MALLKSNCVLYEPMWANKYLSKLTNGSTSYFGLISEWTSFWVIFIPVTQKKYQVSSFLLLKNISLQIFCQPLHKLCSYVSPSKPDPLRSVTGSLPWNPISIHYFVNRLSLGVSGIKQSQICSNMIAWRSSSYFCVD